MVLDTITTCPINKPSFEPCASVLISIPIAVNIPTLRNSTIIKHSFCCCWNSEENWKILNQENSANQMKTAFLRWMKWLSPYRHGFSCAIALRDISPAHALLWWTQIKRFGSFFANIFLSLLFSYSNIVCVLLVFLVK